MAKKQAAKKPGAKKLQAGKRVANVKPLLNPQPLPPRHIPIG